MSVRVGLVGCGLFGECHARALQQLRMASVEAVFDLDEDRARRVAEKYGIPTVCKGLEEICGRDDLDAIDVVTPKDLHPNE